MHQMSYYYLILRYPKLGQFISQCHLTNRTDDLFDFMMGVHLDG